MVTAVGSTSEKDRVRMRLVCEIPFYNVIRVEMYTEQDESRLATIHWNTRAPPANDRLVRQLEL